MSSVTLSRDEWLKFCRENEDMITVAIDEASEDPVVIRSLMAEGGTEVTPSQLHKIIELLKESLKTIRQTGQ